ncbi:hypothetical protein SAMN05192588_0169 [Nonlabens sp. Hel1_33_55]|uniref:hypothetical protein n=1 Tax=Nonlabens sp. Hel1_33_55 TaxID=1336802 RepID=UPI000875A97A|nr:hypothetical protein [Nonlabens sp. Hel1_33_55]SCX89939.1 hypothetical protein SAMN05192588_0169 [Nonlabens sp. Hel1_33_55]
MSKLLNRIDQIELKVKALIHENQRLNKELGSKQESIEGFKKQLEEAQETIKNGSETIVMLKTANAMLGSDDYKTKTKLKINALVREIDQCIAQLA